MVCWEVYHNNPGMLYWLVGAEKVLDGHLEEEKRLEWGKSVARVIAACVVLTLFAGLVGCTSDPAPGLPTPLPATGRTPFPTVSLQLLRTNALAGTRAIDLAEPLRSVVDGTYCTPAWRNTLFPSSLSIPVEPVSGDLLLEWNSSGTNDYISPPDAPTYGLPASYAIATSADSTNGKDGTWHEVVSVKGNTARTREHRFPFAGARWVRMTVKSAVPGPLGNTFAIDEIELHNASNGTDDTVFFLGDSITAAAFNRCPDNQPSFADLVRRAAPAHFPAMIDGGVDGVNSSYGVSAIQDWLALNPDFHIWAIGYGTNDAWQKVPPGAFEEQLQTIVDRVVAAGRVPVIARIPFAAKGPSDADVRALNEVIDLVTARNGLLPGPDLYAWFSSHPDALSQDGVHPSDAGTRSINRLWYEALRPLYAIKP
jgi:acyl-CoA thioesterase-1